MVRTRIPESHRDEIVRDQRLVILLTKKERELYEQAALKHRYRGISDLVRDAVEHHIENLKKADAAPQD